tara:strand:+ start:798 stop:1133 length:336 start_codon:yes stop_codon:yes gene_type:complete
MANWNKPDEKTAKRIVKLANQIANKITSSFARSQYTNELRKDLEQDLWAEFYTVKCRMPDLSTNEIFKIIEQNKYGLKSIPDSKITLQGNNTEGVTLPDGYRIAGNQVFKD